MMAATTVVSKVVKLDVMMVEMMVVMTAVT